MVCKNCNAIFEAEPHTCTSCGFPLGGTDRERSAFIADKIIKKGHIEDAEKSLKQARAILFAIGGITIALTFFRTQSFFTASLSVFLGMVFIIFGITAKKRPFLSLIVPLILLLLFYLVDAIIDPSSLVQGFLWKIIYVTVLTHSVIKVKRAEKIKQADAYFARR